MIEPVKAIRISWDSLSRIVSEEISKILGREICCKASMNDVEYWAIVIQDERIPLSELFKILETVKANEAERQDSLPESAMTQFSVRDIGMEAANLILAGRLGYRWKAQYMDDYGMWILGEKDGENNEAEA